MKKNSIVSGVIGLFLGCLITYFYCTNNKNIEIQEETYFELQEDVNIGESGTLKKGTLLKYDEGYSEGFTRFILYLNAKGIKLKEYETENADEIIPYWLEDNVID